jgi:hypothetical protein
MRFVSTKTHGIIDYLTGVVLIIAPWVLRFADSSAAQWVPVILGIMTLVYSLLTSYELGAAKVLSVPMHLGLDAFSGLLLAASPWLFGFADRVYLPHLIVGIFEIIMSFITYKTPGTQTQGNVSYSKGY